MKITILFFITINFVCFFALNAQNASVDLDDNYGDFLSLFSNCRYPSAGQSGAPVVQSKNIIGCSRPLNVCTTVMYCDAPEGVGQSTFNLTCLAENGFCPVDPKSCARAESPEDHCRSQSLQKQVPRRIKTDNKEGVF